MIKKVRRFKAAKHCEPSIEKMNCILYRDISAAVKKRKKIKLKNEEVILCIYGHLRIGNITSQTFNQEEVVLDSVLPLTLIQK